MKKILCILIIIPTLFSFPVRAQVKTSAKGCILIEAMTGQVLYEYNADAIMPMASTTKLFTALMVRECCELDEVVTVSEAAAQTEGSSAYLVAREQITVEQLLYALLLSSGNDAAEVLAEHVFAGNRDRFIAYMNQRAQELGLVNTHFTNPSGLPDDEHYTTARELAQIGRLAGHDPVIARIAASRSVSFTSVSNVAHSYTNHNSLLRMYNYATGLKTGYTKAAGRCLVSSAQKDGVMLICVTLSDPNDWDDHMMLFEYGFSQVEMLCGLAADEFRISVPVLGGTGKEVAAGNEGAVFLPKIAKMEDYQFQYVTDPLLFAPIEKGQTVGKLYVMYREQPITTIDLVAMESVDSAAVSEKWFIKELKRILKIVLL